MAANALRIPLSLPNPNPNARLGNGLALARLRRPPPAAAKDRAGALSSSSFWTSYPPIHLLPCRRRCLVGYVAHAADAGESNYSDVDVNGTKNKSEEDADGSDKAWKQVLHSFREQAIQMQGVSQEAYKIYSAKAIAILEETSKIMMIQADKASRDIAQIAKEVGEEGREYIVSATENSPDSVKDIVEVFSSPPDDLKDPSKVLDFHVGIPYGSLLAIGGFVSFMVTGSTAAIRFGIILGTLLLSLSIYSLRAWKSGKTSSLLLNGQTAIASILFIREWRLFCQRPSLPSAMVTILSGGVVAFYIYRIIISRQETRSSLDHGSED